MTMLLRYTVRSLGRSSPTEEPRWKAVLLKAGTSHRTPHG